MSESILGPDNNRPAAPAGLSHARFLQSASVGLTGGKQPEAKLQRACREFESVFIAFLLKEMRATVDKSGLIDGGQSEELYQSMLDAEVARKLSSVGGLGLAKMLLDQLTAKRAEGSNSTGDRTAQRGTTGSQQPLKIR